MTIKLLAFSVRIVGSVSLRAVWASPLRYAGVVARIPSAYFSQSNQLANKETIVTIANEVKAC